MAILIISNRKSDLSDLLMRSAQSVLMSEKEAEAADLSHYSAIALLCGVNEGRAHVITAALRIKMEEFAEKEQSIQTRMTSLQSSIQSEGQALAEEEQALAEEQVVLANRFQLLTRKALDELNADKRYKMIINAASVVDADPTLNISSLVLQKIDELYVAGALE